MSDYVIMPANDYQASCDAIRAATGSSNLIKSGDMPSEITKIAGNVGKAMFKRMNMPSAAMWRNITYGNGIFVATTDITTDMVAWSSDGIEWHTSTLPSSGDWNCLAYGNGMFVAVMDDSNVAAVSEDGINWSPREMPSDERWNSAVYGDGKFAVFAGGSGNYISTVVATTTDFTTWQVSNLGTNCGLFRSAYGNGAYVSLVLSGNKFVYSLDGLNWTKSTLPISGTWESLAYGNGRFVAFDTSTRTKMIYSNDGVSWYQANMNGSMAAYDIAYGNNKFVSVGKPCSYSVDGINWTAITMPPGYNYFEGVCYGNYKFVAIQHNSSDPTGMYCDMNVDIA